MAKVYIMIGLPGSGKSTKARQILKEEKTQTIRLNRDDLRESVYSGLKWSGKRERHILALEKAMLRTGLGRGLNVIIDDTNLGKTLDMWKTIIESFNNQNGTKHKIVIHDLTDIPIDDCIENVYERTENGGRFVDPDVIINMAFKNGIIKQEKNWVGFDLDGTLADITTRRKMSEKSNGKLDWKVMFNPNNITYDIPRNEIISQTRIEHEAGNDVIIVSGRSAVTKHETEKWLRQHHVYYDRLIMRPESDFRPDDKLKLWFLDNYLDASKCVKIYDDRPSVIRAWQSRGITVKDCGDGVEF